MHADNLPEM